MLKDQSPLSDSESRKFSCLPTAPPPLLAVLPYFLAFFWISRIPPCLFLSNALNTTFSYLLLFSILFNMGSVILFLRKGKRNFGCLQMVGLSRKAGKEVKIRFFSSMTQEILFYCFYVMATHDCLLFVLTTNCP